MHATVQAPGWTAIHGGPRRPTGSGNPLFSQSLDEKTPEWTGPEAFGGRGRRDPSGPVAPALHLDWTEAGRDATRAARGSTIKR